MSAQDPEFAQYCCELLASQGPCRARRMFGGWGLSVDGLTLAILADLGEGALLWLKADASSQARFEAAGCARFSYLAKGQRKSVGYYCAPAEAMESPALMQPWASLAFQAALSAQAGKVKRQGEATSGAGKKRTRP
jgi:DNA transformation protein